MKSKLEEMLADISLPKMVRVRQIFPNDTLKDVEETVRNKLREEGVADRIHPGMRVVMTGSSRGITNMKDVLKVIVAFVKECGGIPYIIPAMGSHGGSTSEGQMGILKEYGITEEFCGCKIHSSMETVLTGRTDDDLPVYIDKFASEADGIIVVGRIKPHTAFKATYESGLVKMLCIGLGKQKGANSLHDAGFGVFATRIPAFARVVLENNNVLFGVGVIENAFDETCRVDVIKSEEIFKREPNLLEYAKGKLPRIYFEETDILIVREIGKNFSGSGMDPNITGTWSTPYGSGGIRKQRTVVLDVSDESHGNIIGLGKADVTTMRAFQKIDFISTYSNVLTSTVIEPAKIPMVMENDELAIKAAIKTLNGVDKEKCRIIYIKNTLDLEEIYISAELVAEAADKPELEILSAAEKFTFDEEGNLLN